MNRGLLVCMDCKKAIFIDSVANESPRWTGEIGDPPSKRRRINGQDDLAVFKKKHIRHEMTVVELL